METTTEQRLEPIPLRRRPPADADLTRLARLVAHALADWARREMRDVAESRASQKRAA